MVRWMDGLGRLRDSGHNEKGSGMKTKGEIKEWVAGVIPESIASMGDGVYVVGGAVRDFFLGFDPKDVDVLVTGKSYEQIVKHLEGFGSVDVVGQSFGVVKFRSNDGEFDIAIPRRERSTGIGHKDFAVESSPDISVEEDLYRRDFTINSIAIGGDGEVIDPLHGIDDIDKKVIRVNSDESFIDDPLRMMRAVQFAARFGFEIESNTFEQMKIHHKSIGSVSTERIAEELNKMMLKADKPSVGLEIMRKSGMMKVLFPELDRMHDCQQQGTSHQWDVWWHTLYSVDFGTKNLPVRLAMMWHDSGKPVVRDYNEEQDRARFHNHEFVSGKYIRKALERLHYSNDIIEEAEFLVRNHMFSTRVKDKTLRRFLVKSGAYIDHLIDVRVADRLAHDGKKDSKVIERFRERCHVELNKKPPLDRKMVNLDGNDVMRILGIGPGKYVGDVIDYLFVQVVDEPEKNVPEILEKMVLEFHKNQVDHGMAV